MNDLNYIGMEKWDHKLDLKNGITNITYIFQEASTNSLLFFHIPHQFLLLDKIK